MYDSSELELPLVKDIVTLRNVCIVFEGGLPHPEV